MGDRRNTLQAKFAPAHRYANFGDVLVRMRVRGFRCHANTMVEIQSPITAFCGMNGTGKSTLLQVLAIAYKRLAPARPYYVKDFLVIGPLDPAPFSDVAEVEFTYLKNPTDHKTVTISRRPTQRWSGYVRRPDREVYFAGVGHYLPRIEQRDFVVRHAKNLQITAQHDIPQVVREAASTILACQYSAATSKAVTYSRYNSEIVCVRRGGVEYSEAHMGFGEGRTQSLVVALERIPEKSLVLVEEPETSLHPSAQHSLARYLMDVSIRRGHQIFLTTHSEYLLKALPGPSRLYLKRDSTDSIRCRAGLSAAEARSLMTDGATKALTVLVEDECAQAILRELLRRVEPGFLKTTGIYAAGDAKSLARTAQVLRDTGLSVTIVRDGDQPEAPANSIFKLPGKEAPEKEMFNDAGVRAHVETRYGVHLDDFFAGLGNVNHHDWIPRLAIQVNVDARALLVELARTYASNVPENDAVNLRDVLRQSIR
ncbi:MAG: AAA family ATPase [Gemmatimonadota bacterium]|nr:AAA family ATPase [Gemmatimonadota bacterium]